MMRGAHASIPASVLDDWSQRTPDATALIWKGEHIAFGALADASRRVAQGLEEAGLRRGDYVGLWLPNGPEWLTLFFACSRLGVAVIGLNTRFKGVEVAALLERAQASLLVCSGELLEGDGRKALDASSLRHVVRVGGAAGSRLGDDASGPGAIRYETWAAARPMAGLTARPEDPCIVFGTSGSTGTPKLVLHTQASIADHAGEVGHAFGFDAVETVVLLILPLCGAYGFTQAMAALLSGRALVVSHSPAFDADIAGELIQKHAVTTFCAFDEILLRLVQGRSEERPFPSLQWCGYGVINPSLTRVVDIVEGKGIRLRGLYGASEVQAFFSVQDAALDVQRRTLGGGTPVSASSRVRVRDRESGALLGVDEVGELEFFSIGRMQKYLGDPEKTTEKFTEDGFVRSGDIGRLLADGSFVFEGRYEDVLRLSGFLVTAGEIESFVKSQPGIAGCQVVGLATEAGNRPVAFITIEPGHVHDEAGLQARCRAGLAKYKVPVAFHVVDEFPMTAGANAPKVAKAELRKMAAERAAIPAPAPAP